MDVDNENFYDEIASLMPPPGDYSFDDLDEIIRCTDSQLDASLDINAFANAFNQNDFPMSLAEPNELTTTLTEKANAEQIPASQQQHQTEGHENDFHFNFSAYPSPATSQQSAGYSSPNETPARTSSPSSIDEDHFNPDDFINFLNDDDVKIDDLTQETIMKLNENCRNTPSPTGSCTSSSGSSTSGIQSDASSVISMPQNFKGVMTQEQDDDLLEFIKFKNEKSESDIKMNENQSNVALENENNASTVNTVIKEEEMSSLPTTTTATTATILPITLPVLPVTTIQSVPPAVNFVQGTIIPVQTVPLTTVNPVVNIKTPTAIKIENKPAANTKNIPAQTVNVNATNNTASGSGPKVTPPPNTKPKTIYLSSNDFKALMQKMNTNGKKITGANGQMPKIIMKTANGKVIAANKLTNNNTSNNLSSTAAGVSSVSGTASSSGSNAQSLQFVSKMVKATGPMMVKQQPSKIVTSSARSAAALAAARATLSHTKVGRGDLSMLKGLNDEKLLKKQLRMLKNRESASLSRKKKKEYVERLENRISDLEKENYSLKGENSSLRSQLMAFAQTCNCKHGNVSEFILNTLNMDSKNGGAVLNAIDTTYLMNNAKQHLNNCTNASNSSCGGNATTTSTSSTHHVKIAPKPANSNPFINKGFKQRMNAATVKKNVAVLFAMAFMVTLNVGNFQNYINKTALENAIETTVTNGNEEPIVQTGRRLLWVPNEHEFHEQNNRSKRETEMANMPPPPLHFLRPVNRTTADKMNGTSAKDEPPIKRTATMATTYANATQENMRLARNLHKWIGGNDYLNLTGNGIGNDFEDVEHFKFGTGSYMDYDLPLQGPIGTKQKRKIFLNSETHQKHAKLNIEDEHNSLDLFKPRISEEYLRLFRGIKRQDDTFYVLSFNMDHILLPASVYNKSSRPKMSLMLPAGDPSHNGDIVLMQIDCEVINTTELEIKSHMIPEKLRPTKYSSSNVRVNPNDVANNETAGPASAAATKTNDTTHKREETKEKPTAPRTYFMMGPKNQVTTNTTSTNAANIVKRKPTIVKLNANDSVIGSGVLNVRNSTLFSRMRDTIGSQNNGFLAATDVKKLI